MSLLAFAEGAIQLVPDGTLLVHLALIVVMVALLNATLLKPINRILEERDRRTKGRLGEAEGILNGIEEKLGEYKRRLRDARGSAYARLEEERNAASREREKLVAAVKAEIISWQQNEREKLKLAEANVKTSLMKDAAIVASEIGTRILGRPVGK